jgi:primosomal protein N' (replication factor Y)
MNAAQTQSETGAVVRVAVPVPLRQLFDYRLPADVPLPAPGVRVRVPLRGRQAVGVVVDTPAEAAVDAARLKPVAAVLDDEPLWPPALFGLLRWSAGYYHHPEGEVFAAALPGGLGRGEQPPDPPRVWRLTDEGGAVDPDALKRATRQAALLRALAAGPQTEAELRGVVSDLRQPLDRLAEQGWAIAEAGRRAAEPGGEPQTGPELNAEQEAAVATLQGQQDFGAFLLEGVTGSGKTEVYFGAMAPVLARGEQVLVLVPEISLTPQLLDRFRRRLGGSLTVLHSGLADGERANAWQAARTGEAQVVVGTRSAVFVPLARPGLIVVDEEHDPSFKQQEGFRYSGRDLAVVRAAREEVPVVLGTATPSLESLHNARQGRYGHLRLPRRAGEAQLPEITLLDMRGRAENGGLSETLLRELEAVAGRGEQALLFLNRRGFAPAVLCPSCGWTRDCPHCDRAMTLHQGRRLLLCHFCGLTAPVPHQCGNAECGNPDLQTVGLGVEQVETVLAERLGSLARVRVDRDTTGRKGALEDKLARVRSGEADLVVGTQMLVKGHHFPGVTLVAVVAADSGLYSADFRARERVFQQILQVAGRAGRAERPGRVWVQTYAPDHPVFEPLKDHDYRRFAEAELAERRAAGLPPYYPLALVRAEAGEEAAANRFLEAARDRGEALGVSGVRFLGPAPAPLERLRGQYRAQLLVTAEERTALHRALTPWAPQLETLPEGRAVRWSLDVDPQDLF